MYSIDDFYIPMMSEDIMNPYSGYMNSMMSGGYYPTTNLLGGTQIKPQPMQDAYETIDKKKNETKNNFKTILKVIGLLVLGGLISPAFKCVKKSGGKFFGKISQSFGNIFKKGKGTP